MRFVLRPTHSVLHEARESDEIYYKIGQFFVQKVAVPQNLATNKISSTKHAVYLPGKALPVMAPVPTIVIDFKPDILNIVPYGDYVAYTGDDGSKTRGQPIIWEYSYNKIFSKLQFHVVPYINNATAGMTDEGLYLFYKNDWKIDRNLLANKKNIPREQLVDGMPSPQEALQLILNQIKNNTTTFVHEVTHLTNLMRSGGVAYRAKGGDKQYIVGSKEYVSSTEELQSLQIELETHLRKVLQETDINKIYETYDADFMYYLAIRDKIKFVRAFFWNPVINLWSFQAWNKMTPKSKKGLIKRLNEMYDHHLGSKEPGLRKMVKYLASTKMRPMRLPRKYPPIPL